MAKATEYACNFKTSARKLNRVKLDDLLNSADESNEIKISTHIPKFRTDLKAPDIKPETVYTEEDDSISVLKVKLETLVNEDDELNEYYMGLQSRLNQKKIDEIYSIVTANISFEPIRRASKKAATKTYTIKGNNHLSKKDPAKKNPKFIQETLIEGEDEEIASDVTKVDIFEEKDFDELSEKIQKGEIKIEAHDEDSTQLTLDSISAELKKKEEDENNLKIAFDIISGEAGEDLEENADEKSSEGIFSKLFKYRAAKEENEEKTDDTKEEEYLGFEYTSPADKSEAEVLLKKASLKSLKKFLCTTILFALMLGLELSSKTNSSFGDYISYGKYGFVFICAEIQLLFFIIALLFGDFTNGIKGILTGKIKSESIFAVTAVFTTIHSIFSLANTGNGIMLFNIIPALAAFSCSLSTYLKCKKNLYCFSIVASDKEKFVAAELSATSKEASNFYSYLIEDSDVYTVAKTKNVSSFFKRISKRPKSEDILGAIIPGAFFVAAAIYAICFFSVDMSVYKSFTAAVAFICTSVPTCGLFVITLPLFSANRNCKKFESAIIGECAAEEYATASVISFEDKELFPSSKVKMTNIKTFYNMRIDQVIVELAKLFHHLGGPLKDIFYDATDGIFEEHTVIKVIESAENGVMIAADGVDYYLGNGDFMRSHSLEYEDDPSDEAYEKNGSSVMIFGANNVVVAKLYFKYTPQKGFRKLLEHMYNCGLCVGIKTLDPNINNTLLSYHADNSPCPISILKAATPEEISAVQQNVDTGIVSVRSLGAFLKTFMLCDKARHTIKSNGIIMLTGSVLTAVMMIFICFTGGILNYTPAHAFLFQILWSLAIWLLSFLK